MSTNVRVVFVKSMIVVLLCVLQCEDCHVMCVAVR
jgi:hypothetical protein